MKVGVAYVHVLRHLKEVLAWAVNKYPNQKHPSCKKSCSQEMKKAVMKKSKRGGQSPCRNAVDNIKILIMITQAAKHFLASMFCGLRKMFCGLGHHYQNF